MFASKRWTKTISILSYKFLKTSILCFFICKLRSAQKFIQILIIFLNFNLNRKGIIFKCRIKHRNMTSQIKTRGEKYLKRMLIKVLYLHVCLKKIILIIQIQIIDDFLQKCPKNPNWQKMFSSWLQNRSFMSEKFCQQSGFS